MFKFREFCEIDRNEYTSVERKLDHVAANWVVWLQIGSCGCKLDRVAANWIVWLHWIVWLQIGSCSCKLGRVAANWVVWL